LKTKTGGFSSGIKFYWKPRFVVGCSDIDDGDDKEIVFKS